MLKNSIKSLLKIGCLILSIGPLPILLHGQSAIQSAINTFVKDPALQHASVSICVLDVATGKTIASHKPQLSLIPASSLKTVTTATALGVLGPDYTFETLLQYDGTKSGSVLNGNIYIKGSGDPTLGSENMEGTLPLEALMQTFRQAIQRQGIAQVNGYIIGDDSHYGTDATPTTWQWNDLGNYYAAGVWGLNIHENYYYLRFQQRSRLGTTPRIATVEPAVPGLSFINELKSAGSRTGDNAYIYGAPYADIRHIRGTIPLGSRLFSIKGAMPYPAKQAAHYLRENMVTAGISVAKEALPIGEFNGPATKDQNRTTFFLHESPPLRTIVKRTNIKSVNLYCEALLKAIAKKRTGKSSYKDGIKALKDFWADRGLPMKGCFMDDGSGLSARNNVTTYFMAQVLRKSRKDPTIGNALYGSLPVAGKSGILKNALKGTIAEGNIRAKSGTIKRVRAYAGYATNRSGQELSFSILVNNYTGSGTAIRRKMENLMLQFCK